MPSLKNRLTEKGSQMEELHWKAICALAKDARWNGEVPRIRWDLRNAVGSLTAKQRAPWDHPEAISKLLVQNPGIAEIFANYDDTAIAYAFRLARYAGAR